MEDHSPSPPVPTDIPEGAINAKVPLDALYQVLHHGENASGDSHRFSVSADPEDATSKVSGQVVEVKYNTQKLFSRIFTVFQMKLALEYMLFLDKTLYHLLLFNNHCNWEKK